jgi:AcrR family transcriptional regulator
MTPSPDRPHRRRPRDPPATRAAILAAARAMMAERGPASLTLSDVARRAGVNRGTAYQHFATRDAVIAAVLDGTFRATKAALDAGARDTLDARIDRTVRHLVDHPEVVRLSLFRLLAGVPNPREDLWSEYLDHGRRLVSGPGGRPGADADMLAVILLGATLLWSLRVHTGAERAAATGRYLRELKRLLLFGAIRPERRPGLVRSVRSAANAGRVKRRPRTNAARAMPRR